MRRLCVIANILSLSGETNDILKSIQDDYQISNIALTQGAAGAMLLRHSEAVRVRSVPTTVVDTVGAGDAFTAALMSLRHRASNNCWFRIMVPIVKNKDILPRRYANSIALEKGLRTHVCENCAPT